MIWTATVVMVGFLYRTNSFRINDEDDEAAIISTVVPAAAPVSVSVLIPVLVSVPRVLFDIWESPPSPSRRVSKRREMDDTV